MTADELHEQLDYAMKSLRDGSQDVKYAHAVAKLADSHVAIVKQQIEAMKLLKQNGAGFIDVPFLGIKVSNKEVTK